MKGKHPPGQSIFAEPRLPEQAAADARAALHDLSLRAMNGDFDATWELVAVTREISHEIFVLSKLETLPAFKFIASISESWPGLFYAHKEYHRMIEQHVFKTLGLAEYHPTNSAGGFSFHKIENRIARELVRRLNQRRKAGQNSTAFVLSCRK